MHSAEALAAITNPTVNSYKRINAPRTTSGATWSPNTVTYGGNNRTHMIRIPDAGRFELRLADGATNPYLLQAAVLAAGLDGIKNKRDPGKRLDIDMYAEGHTVKDAKRLPLNLLDALARARQLERAQERLRRGRRRLLHQAQARRLERLRRPPDRLGAPARRSIAEVKSRALCPESSYPQALDACGRLDPATSTGMSALRLKDRSCATPSSPSSRRPCRATRAGRPSGAIRSPSRLRRRHRRRRRPRARDRLSTSPRSTASPTSRCWRRAGSAPATSAATPPSSAPTTCCPATPRSTNGR